MFSHDNVIHLFLSSLKRSENANFDTFKVNGYTFRESNSAIFSSAVFKENIEVCHSPGVVGGVM